MNSRSLDRIGQWIQWALIVMGVWLLAWSGVSRIEAAIRQRELQATLARIVAADAKAGSSAPRPRTPPGPLDLVGQLTIPRLGLSAFVAEGDDDSVLAAGIGHLPDTPLPWEVGNSGFAAHRDTYFRPLKDIRVGDDLVLTTPGGDLEYRVNELLVVKPDDVWVLAPTSRASLTLITCYPFTYVGHAPRRFVVHAMRVEPVPDRTGWSPFSPRRPGGDGEARP